MPAKNTKAFQFAFAVTACLVALAGCGGSNGPPRYELTGTVAYRGTPVPAGFITLAPDVAQGNSGPGTHAEILDGRFQTPPGQGTIGGPHVATITGTDGQPYEMDGQINPMGRELFPEYRIELDLPHKPTSHDLIIPE